MSDQMTNPANAVEFDNVSIVFGPKPAKALPLMDAGQDRAEIEAETGQILGVHNCTLDVKQGEILVLMGLSGSGKSTLLRAVNGLNPLVRGSVRVHDGDWSCDVTASSAADLRRVRRECEKLCGSGGHRPRSAPMASEIRRFARAIGTTLYSRNERGGEGSSARFRR